MLQLLMGRRIQGFPSCWKRTLIIPLPKYIKPLIYNFLSKIFKDEFNKPRPFNEPLTDPMSRSRAMSETNKIAPLENALIIASIGLTSLFSHEHLMSIKTNTTTLCE